MAPMMLILSYWFASQAKNDLTRSGVIIYMLELD